MVSDFDFQISKFLYSEIRNQKFAINFVRAEGLEPPCREAPDPKSGMSTNFTTPAILFFKNRAQKYLILDTQATVC
jgi:hypothetical protein